MRLLIPESARSTCQERRESCSKGGVIMSGKKKKETYIQSLEGLTRKHSQWRDVIHRLFKNRLAIVGLILVVSRSLCHYLCKLFNSV